MRILNARSAPVLLFAAGLIGFSGCAPSDPSAPEIEGGAVPPTRVLAVGNSLTAGVTNGGLLARGQVAGFANLVANRINGRDMTMPLIAPPGIGPDGQGTLTVTATGIEFQPLGVSDPRELALALTLPEPYENLGVPSAVTVDVMNATGAATSMPPGNESFELILRNSALPPGGSTQLSQIQALVENGVQQTQTLILWIGNNDVLGGTLRGNPVVGTNITPSSTYETLMDDIVDEVAALGLPQVALVNIPSVTSIPYVTTIVGLLQQGGLGPADIRTEEADVIAILLSAQDVLLNPDFSIKPEYVIGSGSATEETLASQFTLTQAEAFAVGTEIGAYNGYLANVAATRGWALIDVATVLDDLSIDPSARPNAAFPLLPVPGGGGFVQNENAAFSLDAIHLSEIGNARVANEVLDGLNDTYGTSYAAFDLAGFENRVGWEGFQMTTQEFDAGGVYRALAESRLFQR